MAYAKDIKYKIHKEPNQTILFKGIVSRDLGRLQMVLINRSEVCKIPLEVYF
jgi:hypothetical protein